MFLNNNKLKLDLSQTPYCLGAMFAFLGAMGREGKVRFVTCDVTRGSSNLIKPGAILSGIPGAIPSPLLLTYTSSVTT